VAILVIGGCSLARNDAIASYSFRWYSSPSGCLGRSPTLGRTLDDYHGRLASSDRVLDLPRHPKMAIPTGDSTLATAGVRGSLGIPPGQLSAYAGRED